jgi:hypothetical protein
LSTEFECLAFKRELGLPGTAFPIFAPAQLVDEVVGR